MALALPAVGSGLAALASNPVAQAVGGALLNSIRRRSRSRGRARRPQSSLSMPPLQRARHNPAAPPGKHYRARQQTTRVVAKKNRRAHHTKATMKQRLNKLEKYGIQLARYKARDTIYFQINNAVNVCAYTEKGSIDSVFIETRIDSLPYINTADSAIVNINLTASGISNDVTIENCYSKLLVKNNWHLPSEVSVYWFQCVDNTSTLPVAYMLADDANFGITDADTNYQIWPSDFPALRKTWKILKVDKAVLNAGDELQSVHLRPRFKYNPETKDALLVTYLKGDVWCVIRTQGVLCHDVTTTTEIGLCETRLDCSLSKRMDVRYSSDAKFTKFETSEFSGTLAAGGETAGPQVEDIVEPAT